MDNNEASTGVRNKRRRSAKSMKDSEPLTITVDIDHLQPSSSQLMDLSIANFSERKKLEYKWAPDVEFQFFEGIRQFGKDWRAIDDFMKSRTRSSSSKSKEQIRQHYYNTLKMIKRHCSFHVDTVHNEALDMFILVNYAALLKIKQHCKSSWHKLRELVLTGSVTIKGLKSKAEIIRTPPCPVLTLLFQNEAKTKLPTAVDIKFTPATQRDFDFALLDLKSSPVFTVSVTLGTPLRSLLHTIQSQFQQPSLRFCVDANRSLIDVGTNVTNAASIHYSFNAYLEHKAKEAATHIDTPIDGGANLLTADRMKHGVVCAEINDTVEVGHLASMFTDLRQFGIELRYEIIANRETSNIFKSFMLLAKTSLSNNALPNNFPATRCEKSVQTQMPKSNRQEQQTFFHGTLKNTEAFINQYQEHFPDKRIVLRDTLLRPLDETQDHRRPLPKKPRIFRKREIFAHHRAMLAKQQAEQQMAINLRPVEPSSNTLGENPRLVTNETNTLVQLAADANGKSINSACLLEDNSLSILNATPYKNMCNSSHRKSNFEENGNSLLVTPPHPMQQSIANTTITARKLEFINL